MLLHVPRCSNVACLGHHVVIVSIDLRFRLFSLRPFAWEEARQRVSKVVETYLVFILPRSLVCAFCCVLLHSGFRDWPDYCMRKHRCSDRGAYAIRVPRRIQQAAGEGLSRFASDAFQQFHFRGFV